MKKINLLTIMLLLASSISYAQGIQFEYGKNWAQIKEKARQENKYIFVDCYATWCGPCKWMSANIFPQKAVGDFMNEHFINVEVQMDQTASDNVEVKTWYSDARMLHDLYKIDAYPTYMFFSPEGKAVHRFTGASADTKQFLVKAKQAMDPDQQYYALVEHIGQHKRDSAYLHDMLVSAERSHDPDNAAMVANAYIVAVKDPLAKPNLALVKHHITSSNEATFKFFLSHAAEIDQVLKEPGDAEKYIANVIYKEDIQPLFDGDAAINWKTTVTKLKNRYPQLNALAIEMVGQIFFVREIGNKEIVEPYFKQDAPLANWNKITSRIKNKYPDFQPQRMIDSMIAEQKYKYYAYKKNQPKCDQAILAYMEKYGKYLSNYNTNGICWAYVFKLSFNKELLLKAAEWTKRHMRDTTDQNYWKWSDVPADMDTYANLLYKAGQKEEAIKWETKALNVIDRQGRHPDDYDRQDMEITLERMKANKDTWTGRNARGNYERK